MRLKGFGLIILIGLSTFLIVFPVNVLGFDDVDYVFERDILFSDNNPDLDLFNMKVRENLTDTYEATWSFTDDAVGTQNTAISFVDSINTDNYQAEIISDFNGHDKVMTQVRTADFSGGATNVISEVSGRIDFWWDTNVTGALASEFILSESGLGLVVIDYRAGENKIRIHHAATSTDATGVIGWAYVSILFDCTTDKQSVWVNGKKMVSSVDFFSSRTAATVEAITLTEVQTFMGYYDGIGLVGEDGYISFSNAKPVLEVVDGTLETDKYEFTIEGANVFSTIGGSSFGSWVFETTDTGFIQVQLDSGFDRNVAMVVGAGQGTSRLKRENLGITASHIDVNVGWNFTFVGSTHGLFQIDLDSSDNTQVVFLKADLDTGLLTYWNGGSFIFLRSGIALNEFYDMNLFLDYDTNMVRLEFFEDGAFVSNHIFEMIATGKTGLKKIELTLGISDGQGQSAVRVDYVGLFLDGDSWNGEIGLAMVDIGKEWNFENHYLYSFKAIGRIHQGAVNGTYDPPNSLFANILNTTSFLPDQTGVTLTHNIFDSFLFSLSDATLIYSIIGQDFSIDTIAIEGSKLVEGVNEHFLQFTSSGVSTQDSYFFVDNNNRLQFIHIADNNSVLEFIQAEFDIVNRSSSGTVVSFESNIDNNALGFFRINFNGTSQVIQIENIQRTRRILLNTGLILDSFIVLVSDLDRDSITGETTGFVRDISLLDVETSIISIVTLNLIDMLIPLIIILIPTFVIAGFSKKFVIPAFLLISIVLTVSGMIPTWLFFIIGISMSLFIFIEREGE